MNEAKQGSSNTRVALGFTAPLHFWQAGVCQQLLFK